MSSTIESFVVKQYNDDPHPSLKGNGFDGLTIGDYRDEAETFVAYVNALIADAKRYRFWRAHEQGIECVVDGLIQNFTGEELDAVTDRLANSLIENIQEKP